MTRLIIALLAVAPLVGACSSDGSRPARATNEPGLAPEMATAPSAEGTVAAQDPAGGQAAAVFAGGCFWCMEHPFDELPGVVSTTSGYTGGDQQAPSYEQVGSGRTGHVEAIRVVYDPRQVSYERLLDVYWHNIDPTQDDGQFCDRGQQYRSAIFVANAEERRLAEESRRAAAAQLDDEVVTEIREARPFWTAEDYHQDYYRTHPGNYQRYRTGCGRDRRLQELWGAGEH